MRYLTLPVADGTDPNAPDAYWKMAASAADARTVTFPTGFTWIGLDPVLSTPNVIVGVVLPGGRAVPLVPGRAIPIDPRTTSVRVFNVHLATYTDGFYLGTGRLGRAIMVAGNANEASMWFATTPGMAPAPKAAVLVRMDSMAAAGAIRFPTSNLRGVAVSVVCQGPLGPGNEIPPPADFAATFRPCRRNVTPSPNFAPWMQGDILERGSAVLAGVTSLQSDLDVVLSQNNTTSDLLVTTPHGAAGLDLISFAGAGVNALEIEITGR